MTGILKKAIEESAKKYPKGGTMYFDDLKSVEVRRISTGLPSLDLIMGGGIPEGRILEIFGPESSGKTTLAIKFLIECQKTFPKKPVMFIDMEHAFDPAYATKLGLQMHGDRFLFLQPDSAEQALQEMMHYAGTGEVSGIVLDSVAQLVPMKEAESTDIGAEMGLRARIMSSAARRLAVIADNNKCTCFFTNQTRSKLGVMYGDPETTPGGSALKFAASIRIKTTIKKAKEYENTSEVTMRVIKNKVGVPFRTTKVLIKYGDGFDYLNDLVTTALLTGIIKKNGPMFMYADKKWKGQEAMREEIIKDEKLQKEIQEVIANSTTNDVIVEPGAEESEIDFATGDLKDV